MLVSLIYAISGFSDSAVVKIFVYSGDFAVQEVRLGSKVYPVAIPSVGHGSGTLISPDGLILTAKHVVKDAKLISVYIPGYDIFYPGYKIYEDEKEDFAIIQITGNFQKFVRFPKKPSNIRKGMEILIWGYPIESRELEPSVTKGIISRYSSVYNLWETDAAANPGNSGGPVTDLSYNFIGILVAGIPGAKGMNYFLPLNRPIKVFKELEISGRLKTFKRSIEKIDPEIKIIHYNLADYLAKITMNPDSFLLLAGTEKLSKILNISKKVKDTAKISGELANVYALYAGYIFDLAMAYLASKNYTLDDVKYDRLASEDEDVFFSLILLASSFADKAIKYDPDFEKSDFISTLQSIAKETGYKNTRRGDKPKPVRKEYTRSREKTTYNRLKRNMKKISVYYISRLWTPELTNFTSSFDFITEYGIESDYMNFKIYFGLSKDKWKIYYPMRDSIVLIPSKLGFIGGLAFGEFSYILSILYYTRGERRLTIQMGNFDGFYTNLNFLRGSSSIEAGLGFNICWSCQHMRILLGVDRMKIYSKSETESGNGIESQSIGPYTINLGIGWQF